MTYLVLGIAVMLLGMFWLYRDIVKTNDIVARNSRNLAMVGHLLSDTVKPVTETRSRPLQRRARQKVNSSTTSPGQDAWDAPEGHAPVSSAKSLRIREPSSNETALMNDAPPAKPPVGYVDKSSVAQGREAVGPEPKTQHTVVFPAPRHSSHRSRLPTVEEEGTVENGLGPVEGDLQDSIPSAPLVEGAEDVDEVEHPPSTNVPAHVHLITPTPEQSHNSLPRVGAVGLQIRTNEE